MKVYYWNFSRLNAQGWVFYFLPLIFELFPTDQFPFLFICVWPHVTSERRRPKLRSGGFPSLGCRCVREKRKDGTVLPITDFCTSLLRRFCLGLKFLADQIAGRILTLRVICTRRLGMSMEENGVGRNRPKLTYTPSLWYPLSSFSMGRGGFVWW